MAIPSLVGGRLGLGAGRPEEQCYFKTWQQAICKTGCTGANMERLEGAPRDPATAGSDRASLDALRRNGILVPGK